MFGVQFYPTPKEIAIKLFQMIDVEEMASGPKRFRKRDYVFPKLKKILEPSAGKGDLIKHYKSYLDDKEHLDCYWDYKLEVDVCELDPNLSSLLEEYRLIGDDFLDLNDPLYYDLILMNPPFQDGVHHVLHAYDNSQGGYILAILNAETIRNPKDQFRKRLSDIIGEHGDHQFVTGGFTDAERTTDVECALIMIKKPAVQHEEFTDFGFDKEIVDDNMYEFTSSAELQMRENKLQQLERLYSESTALFKTALVAYTKLSAHISAIGGHGEHGDKGPMDQIGYINLSKPESFAEKHQQFLSSLKMNAWKHLLDNSKFKSRLDSSTRKDFDRFINQRGNMAFTVKNMMQVFEMIVNNQGLYQQKAIEQAFDFLTRHAHWGNRDPKSGPGWKTNDAYEVKKKVILPYGCRFDKSWYNKGYKQSFSTPYDGTSEWNDLDMAMRIISGDGFNTTYKDGNGRECDTIVSIRRALDNKFRIIGSLTKPAGNFDKTAESTYFKLRFNMSGTVHLEWKDEKLRQKFNRRACEGKGWLAPPKPKKEPEPESSEIVMYDEADALF